MSPRGPSWASPKGPQKNQCEPGLEATVGPHCLLESPWVISKTSETNCVRHNWCSWGLRLGAWPCWLTRVLWKVSIYRPFCAFFSQAGKTPSKPSAPAGRSQCPSLVLMMQRCRGGCRLSSSLPRNQLKPAEGQWWNIHIVLKTRVKAGASLVVQWLRIRLPMQKTWVRSLVREDPTCCGATKPTRHNYWACALEPGSHNYWSPWALEPVLSNRRSHCNEKPMLTTSRKKPTQQQRPNPAKNK